MTLGNLDLGKPLYERFVSGEYDRDWSNLPAGVKARWNEVATVNRSVAVTISADNATITKAIEKLQADIAVVFQQHRAAHAEISRALALAGNRLQRLSVEFVMGSSQAIEVREWAEEARAAIENVTHFRNDNQPAPDTLALRDADVGTIVAGVDLSTTKDVTFFTTLLPALQSPMEPTPGYFEKISSWPTPSAEPHLRDALAAIVAIGNAEPRTIHDQQTQRYSQKAIDIARKALAAIPSPETHQGR